jgi:hypothetical protein
MEFHALGSAGGAGSAAGDSAAGAGSCANAEAQGTPTAATLMKASKNTLIIDWYPEVALGDYSLAAAPVSKIPTKLHPQRRQSPGTR